MKPPPYEGRTRPLEERLNVFPCRERGVQYSERRRKKGGCDTRMVKTFRCVANETSPYPLHKGDNNFLKTTNYG